MAQNAQGASAPTETLRNFSCNHDDRAMFRVATDLPTIDVLESAPSRRAAARVIPFARPVRADIPRIADAQTLYRARAAKALEEVSTHVAAARALIEPFSTALVIGPTAHLLKMCADGLGCVFDDLDHIGFVKSVACSAGASAAKNTDAMGLVGVQRKGGAV